MKPLIIIPDENQKTITMTIEDFKKTISEVWEDGYKDGQKVEKTSPYTFPWITTTTNPHIYYDTAVSSACSAHSEAKSVDNFINKRTFEKENSNFKDTKTNVW